MVPPRFFVDLPTKRVWLVHHDDDIADSRVRAVMKMFRHFRSHIGVAVSQPLIDAVSKGGRVCDTIRDVQIGM